MVGTDEVLRQFHRIGVKPSPWARAEIKELGNLMVPGEQLKNVVFGWYENGFALLCCTDQRVLLIDKKPFFLKMEDLRYDKISEIKFLNRLLDSTVVLSYAGQKLDFKSWNQQGLRKLMEYVQDTIMRINRFQWQAVENPQPAPPPQEPVQKIVAPEPVAATEGLSYELTAYPDELMQRAQADLGIIRNPYAPTTKFMRRRIPLLGFNQSSR
jgi:hypothetical protein